MSDMSRVPFAFVMMPFAPEFDDVFRELICPALEGYDVSRADTRMDERGILEKIVTGIHDADLVVADVSNTNANVMYELGVAHTMGKPTIMIAQSVATLPFDIRSYPVHEYAQDLASKATTIKQIGQLAEAYRQGLIAFANPVLDFAPTLSEALAPSFRAATSYSPEDFLHDFQAAMTFMHSFDERLGTIAKEHTRQLTDALPKLSAGSWKLSPFDDPGICEASDCTRSFSADLDKLSDDFHAAWERFGRAMMWMLSPKIKPQIPIDRLRSFASTAQTIDKHLNGTLGSLAELRRVHDSFPGYSGNLSHAFNTAREAVTRLLNEIMTTKGYLARIRSAV